MNLDGQGCSIDAVDCIIRNSDNTGDPNVVRIQKIESPCDGNKPSTYEFEEAANQDLDPLEQVDEGLALESDTNNPAQLMSLSTRAYSRFIQTGDLDDLDQSMSHGTRALSLFSVDNPDYSEMLKRLVMALLERFDYLGDPEDLEKAIDYGTQLDSSTSLGHSDLDDRLFVISGAYSARYNLFRSSNDLDMHIEYIGRSVLHTLETHPDFPLRLLALGASCYDRFKRSADLADLNRDIECTTRALSFPLDARLDLPVQLSRLSVSYHLRFERIGDLEDLNKAVEYDSQSLNLTPENDTERPYRLSNLSVSYRTRFERSGDIIDINKSIECASQAHSLTPKGDPDLPYRTNNLGASFHARFQHLREIEDLNKAIDYHHRAHSLVDEEDSDTPDILSSLGTSYHSRFQHMGDLDDLDKAIDYGARAYSLTSKDDSDLPDRLTDLSILYDTRFDRLGNLHDINQAIEYITEARLLTPQGDTKLPYRLGRLGISYFSRFLRSKESSDIDKAIEYQTEAYSLTPEGHRDRPFQLNRLGASYQARFQRQGNSDDLELAIQYELQSYELTPKDHLELPHRLSRLGSLYTTRFDISDDVGDLDKAIEYGIQSYNITPPGHLSLPHRAGNLQASYYARFRRLGYPEDIEQAINFGTEARRLTPSDHPELFKRLSSLGEVYRVRFLYYSNPDDLDHAIDCGVQASSRSPEDHPDYPILLDNLAGSYFIKFKITANLDDLNKAIEYESQAHSLISQGHPFYPELLTGLGESHHARFELLNSPNDLNQALDYHSQAYLLTPKDHPNRVNRLAYLGVTFNTTFHWLKNQKNKSPGHIAQEDHALAGSDKFSPIDIDILNKGIKSGARVFSLTSVEFQEASNQLGCSNMELNGQDEDQHLLLILRLALHCFREACCSLVGDPYSKILPAYLWAKLATEYKISDNLEAYRMVIELIPMLIWLGGTVGQRYNDLKMVGGMALEAVASAISCGKYNLALEWLEQGRSIVWNQTLSLNSPLDSLRSVDPDRANRFQVVANALHSAGPRDAGARTSLFELSTIERADRKHREYAKEYTDLLSQIRQLPGFEAFLRPKTATQLSLAARNGPVVVVNCDEDRCDALILKPGSSEVHHLALPHLTYQKTHDIRTQMSSSLQRTRTGARVDRHIFQDEPEDDSPNNFKEILANIWEDIVQPVLEYLEFLKQAPEKDLPHITWCTTGPLSFLPLHAAGYYDRPRAKLSDYAISSYTPMLSVLIPSELTFPEGHSSILAIGQKATPGFSVLPGTTMELAHIKRHAGEVFRYKQLVEGAATLTAVLDEMERHDWIHLACHAHQSVIDPTKSGFFLQGGTLSLSEIMKKSFRNKGLAFLSACQTATGDKDLTDEVVHLASGMLIAGYPSVIASMWEVGDSDAPFVAERVYSKLMKDGKMNFRDAARALHYAVAELRQEVGDDAFVSWAPYIHIGM